MDTCNFCKSSYDNTNVVVPSPLPDYMCAVCGTQLTKEQTDSLTNELNVEK